MEKEEGGRREIDIKNYAKVEKVRTRVCVCVEGEGRPFRGSYSVRDEENISE